MSAVDTALLATEQRLRAQNKAQVATLGTAFGATLAEVVRADPAGTGTELLSRPDVDQALTGVLDTAQTNVIAHTRAGHQAAVVLGVLVVAAALSQAPHRDPGTAFIDAVISDVTAAFGATLLAVKDVTAAAFDGVSGPNPAPARVLTTHAALRRVSRRLNRRVGAAGSVAVHRGFSDAQQASYAQYAADTGVRVVKRWQVTSTDPCPACSALDGTEVALGVEFDHQAGAEDGRKIPAVYRDLQMPPRHPHCRCRILFTAESAKTATS